MDISLRDGTRRNYLLFDHINKDELFFTPIGSAILDSIARPLISGITILPSAAMITIAEASNKIGQVNSLDVCLMMTLLMERWPGWWKGTSTSA